MCNEPLETLDIVNTNNEIIGTASRQIVHRQKLCHRSAHLIITNPLSQVLMQLRSAAKDNFPNKWDSSVAGHVDSGETYLQCIQRESCEELGIETNHSLVQIGELPASADNGWEFIQIFWMTHEGPFVPAEREIERIEWFSVEKLTQMLSDIPSAFAGGFASVIRPLLSRLVSTLHHQSHC